jgi:hypothetical protein
MEEIEKRPFFITYDNIKSQWILHIKDPKTEEVIERKIFVNGGWKKFRQNA